MHTVKLDNTADIYAHIPLKDIPWNRKKPPSVFVKLLDSGKINPCKTIDLGCGLGNYSIYLAQKGFSITGVDRSPTAIRIAKKQAQKKDVKCQFLVLDVLKELKYLKGEFDFAFDWQLLHHIFPQYRRQYVQNVYRLLTLGSNYLSVCFHDKDPQFGGSGKYRRTPLESTLYFSSEKELRNLFSPFFNIIDFQIIQSHERGEPHIMNYVLMEKK